MGDFMRFVPRDRLSIGSKGSHGCGVLRPCWVSRLLLFAMLLGVVPSAGAACTFRTNPGAITFTAFDPSVASTQTAATTARVNCSGAVTTPTWAFSSSNGGASPRMKHTTMSVYISYSVAAAYASGPANNQLFNITATVLGANYQNAQVGSYSDTLTYTITP
jgi:spore coat protein U-like protein